MKKRSAIALASLAALTLASCNRQASVPEPIEPVVVPETQVSTETEAATSGEDAIQRQVFATPDGVLVTQADAETQLPGLIPSTDADLRVKAVGKGRQDPFSGRVVLVRPLPPDPEVIDETEFVGPSGVTPSAPFSSSSPNGSSANQAPSAVRPGASGSNNNARVAPGPSSSGRGGRSSQSSQAAPSRTPSATSPARPGGSSGTSGAGSADSTVAADPNLPDLTPRPPIPDPSTARAVEVSGVVQIGSNFQAIVKAPDEPTSRYVSVGQRLSNGRVLVKRIESNGSEPVVILEEGGVEVVRAIGSGSSEGDDASA